MKALRNLPLIATHLLVLGLAYGITHNLKPETEPELKESPRRTRSSNRSSAASSSDGPELLAEFRKDFSQKKSRYEELKESLTPAADPKAAALAAIEEWKNEMPEQDRIEAFSMMEARFFHWLKANPREAMQYFATAEKGIDAMKQSELISILGLHVLPDVAREQGVMKSLDWLTMHPAGLQPLWTTLIGEMKDGGGLALFLRVEEALSKTSNPWANIGEGYQEKEMLREVGAAVRFAEKEKLLEYVKLQKDENRAMNLLLGFARTGEAATTWALGLVERGELSEEVASRTQGGIGNEALKQPGMDMEKRIAARRFTQGNEKKPRENILGELVGGDVKNLLVNGRDWRFEFRHGIASLDDILAAVNGTLKITDEGRDAVNETLYGQLSEENPEKALPLLDGMTEEKRRQVLFSSAMNCYVNNPPDDYLHFLSGLPKPVTDKEKDQRLKGWEWKARGCLDRYGDDYVEWVAALPASPDKYAAINAIIWNTRQENPAKGNELNQRFYPKKP